MLQLLRWNPVILTLTLLFKRSILTLVQRLETCNPLAYKILAGMLLFFEKLKPAIKNIIISDCTF